jgi:hypothetical protein
VNIPAWVLALVPKKKVIGWISAALIAVAAAATGMQSAEFKSAVCDAGVVQLPAPVAPVEGK